jgi:DNA-binding MarR family transcriptional regulator
MVTSGRIPRAEGPRTERQSGERLRAFEQTGAETFSPKLIYIVVRYNYPSMKKRLRQPDYQSLADLRYEIRKFLHFSEQAARAAGVEPHQHQFMLALKGLPKGVRPRIGELAERLQIRHHSAVELVNRLSAGGYIQRHRAEGDRREVLLALTPGGERALRELSLHHRHELRLRGPALVAALKRAMQVRKTFSRTAPNAPARVGTRKSEPSEPKEKP